MVPSGSSASSVAGGSRIGERSGARIAAGRRGRQSPMTAQRKPIMMKKPVNRAISPIAP